MRSAIRVRRLRTLADLLAELGDLPPERVRLHPAPGHATEADLVRVAARKEALYELVDGTIVLKAFGWPESRLVGPFIGTLWDWLIEHEAGELVGPSCHFRLRPGLIRSPSIALCLWETLEGVDQEADIADCVPDLAVEIVRPTNPPKEMTRKRREYFKAGTRLIWEVYPRTRTVLVYTGPTKPQTFTDADAIDGGDILPGLQFPLKGVFDRVIPPSKRKKS